MRMRHRVKVVSQHEDAICRRVQDACIDDYGMDLQWGLLRAAQIRRLPTVNWKGRTLYTIWCNGDYGKGPHLMNVPESLLWNLIHIEAHKCAFHR